MRQTLFYLPTQINGLPLFGKGVFFWVILIAGLYTIIRSLLQKRRVEDILFSCIVTTLGLFLVSILGPRIVENSGFPIRGYGVFLTLAIILSGGLTVWRGQKRWNYPPELVTAICFVAAFFGIMGARLFYVIQYWRDIQEPTLRQTLISIIDVTNGGLVVYGSIIGGVIAGIAFILHKRLPLLGTLDLFAPGLMLGLAIGRLGCLMNGCCFGGVCDLPWAIEFPNGSPAHTQQMYEGVISLYGITLAPPQSDSPTETSLFKLKSKHVNLASEINSPIIVAAVDPHSEAELAGVKPGARICEIGLAPKGFISGSSAKSSGAPKSKIRRYRPENNAQVFYFFLNYWHEDPNVDVFLVIQDSPVSPSQPDAATTDTSAQSKPQPAQIRNIVFHPTPSKAKRVHPTQIYSSLSALFICGLLLLLTRFTKRDGVVFAALFILYPINRFCLELLRTDEESFHGTGLTVSQCVSVCLLTLGTFLMIFCFSRPRKQALDGFFSKERKPTQPESSST